MQCMISKVKAERAASSAPSTEDARGVCGRLNGEWAHHE